MSQYPSPYNPPPQYPYGYGYEVTQVDDLAPAKRAAVMMWIIGGLMLVAGLCCGAISGIALEQWPPEMQAQLSKSPMAKHIQTIFAAVGGTVGVPGLIMIVLAFYVRRGGMGSAVTSIVLVSNMIFALLVLMIPGLLQAGQVSGGDLGVFLLMLGVPLILFVVLLFMLIAAVQAAVRIRARAMQYQSQYWQYQQNQFGGTPPPSASPPNPPQEG